MGRMLHSDARQVYVVSCKDFTTDVTVFSPGAHFCDTGGLGGKLRPTGLSAAANVPQDRRYHDFRKRSNLINELLRRRPHYLGNNMH
jgi:hypothetical protein